MTSVAIAVLLASAALATEAPTRIKARSTSICGQWDSVETGVYTVYQDLWNEDAGTGSQCTTVDSLTDGVLAWSTEWSWSGGSSDVKSFANAVTNFTIATLSSISTIPSKWSWTYTGTDIVADVAYDLFTSSTATGSDEYEVMIWLDALGGAGPISSTGSAVATPEIAGTTWELYDGYNGAMHVFSFVASSAVEDFDGDLREFFTYLISNEGMSESQYLLSIGAGSEPFTGTSAVFSVATYSCGVSTGTVAATAAANSAAVATSVGASATAIVATSSAVSSPSNVTFSTATPASSPQGSFSQGGFPSQYASGSAKAPTTAAPVTAAPSSAAPEPATTLATTTKKTCNKKRKN